MSTENINGRLLPLAAPVFSILGILSACRAEVSDLGGSTDHASIRPTTSDDSKAQPQKDGEIRLQTIEVGPLNRKAPARKTFTFGNYLTIYSPLQDIPPASLTAARYPNSKAEPSLSYKNVKEILRDNGIKNPLSVNYLAKRKGYGPDDCFDARLIPDDLIPLINDPSLTWLRDPGRTAEVDYFLERNSPNYSPTDQMICPTSSELGFYSIPYSALPLPYKCHEFEVKEGLNGIRKLQLDANGRLSAWLRENDFELNPSQLGIRMHNLNVALERLGTDLSEENRTKLRSTLGNQTINTTAPFTSFLGCVQVKGPAYVFGVTVNNEGEPNVGLYLSAHRTGAALENTAEGNNSLWLPWQ